MIFSPRVLLRFHHALVYVYPPCPLNSFRSRCIPPSPLRLSASFTGSFDVSLVATTVTCGLLETTIIRLYPTAIASLLRWGHHFVHITISTGNLLYSSHLCILRKNLCKIHSLCGGDILFWIDASLCSHYEGHIQIWRMGTLRENPWCSQTYNEW